MTKTFSLAACVLLAMLAMHPPVHALDSASLPSSIRLANARAMIEARDWKGAIAELQGVNAPGDADWNNLMGFSHRKAKTPDYAAAERFYDTALRIEPSHRGALSYSGELYLALDNLPKAEQRLTTLKLVCNNACFELDRLSQAIDRYKAAGNKYVPEP
ncbi:tetratricopeptide repeat protein [Variovorax paradoxus]|nr:tetratricopeptide repeat protein [Variovorax paradoxus]